jgi:energy-coupling factor transporter ATP-binding protein EcfA2
LGGAQSVENLVEVSNYSFIYRKAKKQALFNVSFSIKRNEFLAIVGPTAAGKTTICRSITGLIPELYPGKSSGSIHIMGKPVSQYRVEEIASFIGYVHQDAESQILMTNVEKEIAFPLENLAFPREEIVERVENALKLVHLEQYRNRHPFYLSGGQRQRVVLATALAMNPDILILDEAVSEIDPLGAEEIINVAKELRDMGKTIVFIEHNMEEIARFADRIIVLNEGRVVADDKTEDVLCDMELLKKLDIYPPEITQLFLELKKRDVPGIERIPINPEDGREMLRKILDTAR